MTDRIMVYPGAIPLETDLLYSNKFAMMGLAKLSSAMMGSTTYLHGLQCTPSSPASMVINVARGQIYSVQNVDNIAYSSLAADTVNTILKQGVVLSSTAFTLTAPTTAGQSINYLVQVTYTDTDSGSTVLPYYNASNPSVAYSGPNNSGVAQNTIRSGVCTVAIKAGVAATTGTQTTPSVDTGYTAAWVITVAQGATTVTAANISVAANAPFLPAAGLAAAIQQCTMTYAVDTGAANAYVAQFVPAIPTLSDGMRFTFKAKVANTGSSTFAANGGSSYPIYSHANQALQGGEIVANGLIEVEWNSTLTAWVLCGNSGGALAVAAASQSNHAMQLGQATGRLLNIQQFSSSGTYTPTAGTTRIVVEVVAGGGGGGAALYTTSSQVSMGGGGGGGGTASSLLQLSSITTPTSVTVGAGGSGGTTSAIATSGGNSSFGSYLSASGGTFGPAGTAVAVGATQLTFNGGGGDATGGNIYNAMGLAGGQGLVLASGYVSGGGGASSKGAGGVPLSTVGSSTTGRPGRNGSGGGGAYSYTSASVVTNGGAGGAGIVYVWEYA
ncbi:phage tail protein [Rahnella sp. PD12R]|uniref:glycine-rich domain-containing protein n=1 Tax=Rahnella sp. PD12R TaxID=2855688 RepID=UPI001C48768F|nr:phage tail protein [Rahnella sp. PD12R]MBV6817497.1 phage tail protein [Rahnella sp. PD12R]